VRWWSFDCAESVQGDSGCKSLQDLDFDRLSGRRVGECVEILTVPSAAYLRTLQRCTAMIDTSRLVFVDPDYLSGNDMIPYLFKLYALQRRRADSVASSRKSKLEQSACVIYLAIVYSIPKSKFFKFI
jgi:hypothetical protein